MALLRLSLTLSLFYAEGIDHYYFRDEEVKIREMKLFVTCRVLLESRTGLGIPESLSSDP